MEEADGSSGLSFQALTALGSGQNGDRAAFFLKKSRRFRGKLHPAELAAADQQASGPFLVDIFRFRQGKVVGCAVNILGKFLFSLADLPIQADEDIMADPSPSTSIQPNPVPFRLGFIEPPPQVITIDRSVRVQLLAIIIPAGMKNIQ